MLTELGTLGTGTGIGSKRAGAGPGHRYWRVYTATVSIGSTRCGAAEISMALSDGGADETGSGTASASNQASGAASQAFDNNNATEWTTGSSNVPGWIGYDFGVGVVKAIRSIVYRSSATTGRAPLTGAIEYSDDGTNWSVAYTLPAQSEWTASETRTFNFT